MAKVLIHYFSGTGNTKRAVDVIRKELQKNNYEVSQLVISNGKPDLSEKADGHIFAFPTLSWSAPVLVKKYLAQLPDGEGAKAAVLAVYAGDPGQAALKVEQMLRRKNYQVILRGGAIYPSNWSQMTNPPSVSKAKEKIATGDQMAQEFAERFRKGEPAESPEKTGGLTTRLMAFFFGLFGRRFLGKAYIADSHCNRCGLCVKACPVHTIKFAGVGGKKPHWKFNCEDCARCINVCPQKAIQVSMPKLIIHFLLLFTGIGVCFPIAGRVVSMIPKTFSIIGWIASFIIAFLVILWLQFAVIDRFIFLLEQMPLFRKFFEKSLTKNYNRYTAPGYHPERMGQ